MVTYLMAKKTQPTARKKKSARVIRSRGGGTLTEAEYWGKIRSALRRTFLYWPPMQQALKAAQRKSQSSNKRLKFEYRCGDCHGWFPRADVEIDHVVSCGSLRNFEDIVTFLMLLTAEDPNSFQILCERCHQLKTNYEAQSKRLSIT